jgi:hypothetical protein
MTHTQPFFCGLKPNSDIRSRVVGVSIFKWYLLTTPHENQFVTRKKGLIKPIRSTRRISQHQRPTATSIFVGSVYQVGFVRDRHISFTTESVSDEVRQMQLATRHHHQGKLMIPINNARVRPTPGVPSFGPLVLDACIPTRKWCRNQQANSSSASATTHTHTGLTDPRSRSLSAAPHSSLSSQPAAAAPPWGSILAH